MWKRQDERKGKERKRMPEATRGEGVRRAEENTSKDTISLLFSSDLRDAYLRREWRQMWGSRSLFGFLLEIETKKGEDHILWKMHTWSVDFLRGRPKRLPIYYI